MLESSPRRLVAEFLSSPVLVKTVKSVEVDLTSFRRFGSVEGRPGNPEIGNEVGLVGLPDMEKLEQEFF